MDKGLLKLVSVSELTENQQVIVLHNNKLYIGKVESLFDYKLRFWNKAKSDKEKLVWISSNNKEFKEFSFDNETNLSNIFTLAIEYNINDFIPVNYTDWQKAIKENKLDKEVFYTDLNNIAKIN